MASVLVIASPAILMTTAVTLPILDNYHLYKMPHLFGFEAAPALFLVALSCILLKNIVGFIYNAIKAAQSDNPDHESLI